MFGARGIPSTYSGFETFLTVLLPELAARGHRVTAYCRRGDVPPLPSYAGVNCVHLRGVQSKQLSTPVHGWIAATRAIRARHDAVLVVNVANATACLAARLCGQRVALNTDGLEWERSKWSRLGRSVFLGSAHLARWATSALVADSVAMRDVYRDKFGADSTVIPYCWTDIQPAPPSALERWGLAPRGYVLLAGRLVPENNADVIAAAYLESDLALPLVVLGAANYRSPVVDRLRGLAGRDARLVLPGHIDDRSQFAGLVAHAAAYVHGHSVGGINPVLIEAMGCGARIVALDTVFNREALGRTGDYFSRPASVVEPLRRVVAEPPETSDDMRESARTRAFSRFAVKAVTDAYESLLLRVADGRAWGQYGLATQWEDADQ